MLPDFDRSYNPIFFQLSCVPSPSRSDCLRVYSFPRFCPLKLFAGRCSSSINPAAASVYSAMMPFLRVGVGNNKFQPRRISPKESQSDGNDSCNRSDMTGQSDSRKLAYFRPLDSIRAVRLRSSPIAKNNHTNEFFILPDANTNALEHRNALAVVPLFARIPGGLR